MLIRDFLLPCFSPAGEGAPSSGGTDDPSGNDGDDKPDDDLDDPASGKPDSVSRSAYEKAVREVRNARERVRAFEAKEQERETEALRKKGDFEALLATERTKNEQLSGKLSAFEAAIMEGRKETAIRKALGKALEPKWDRLLASFVDSVDVDSDGKIDARSVKKLADDFSREYPEAFGEIKTPGTPNPKGGGDGTMTKEQWKAMPPGPAKRAAMAKVID